MNTDSLGSKVCVFFKPFCNQPKENIIAWWVTEVQGRKIPRLENSILTIGGLWSAAITLHGFSALDQRLKLNVC